MGEVPLYSKTKMELTAGLGLTAYRGTSLIRKHHPVGPYSRTMSRLLW